MKLREALDQTATGVLRRMALLHGLPGDEAVVRSELVERLCERFADEAYLRARIAALHEPERRALDAARAGGGEVRGYLLGRILGSGQADTARPLLEQGLLFRTFAAVGPHRGEVFAVPDEILVLLAQDERGQSGPDRGLPATTEAPPSERRRASDPVFSLFALASFIQRHLGDQDDADAGAQAAAFLEETSAWAEEPGGWPWQERWSFLRHLALSAGLLGRKGEGPAAPTSLLLDLFEDRGRLLQRLWRAFEQDREWSELVRASIPQADDLAQQVDPPSLREAVFRALAKLPAGTWFSLGGLLAWLERAIPTFLREQLDTRSAALLDPNTGDLLLGEDSWQRVEAPLLRYLLLGPLYWLGAMGTDASGERVAITGAGAAMLARSGAPPPRPVEPCTWEGSGHFLAPARAELGTLLRVERYLTLETRGQPSRYLLQRDRVAAALASGGSVEECRQLLERLTRGSLPDPVRGHLDEWQMRFGAIAVRPTVLVEARTPEDFAAIEALPGVKALLRRNLSPTVAEIPASHAADLAQALRAAGHLPRVDAALRLMAGRKAYMAFVDERVLEFLLVSLLAFQRAQPEHLARLEGSLSLLDRLEGLFPRERLARLREAASLLAGELRAPARPRAAGTSRRSRRPRAS